MHFYFGKESAVQYLQDFFFIFWTLVNMKLDHICCFLKWGSVIFEKYGTVKNCFYDLRNCLSKLVWLWRGYIDYLHYRKLTLVRKNTEPKPIYLISTATYNTSNQMTMRLWKGKLIL